MNKWELRPKGKPLPAGPRRRRRTRGRSRGNPATPTRCPIVPRSRTRSSHRSGRPSRPGSAARRTTGIETDGEQGLEKISSAVTRVPMRNCLIAFKLVVLVAERPKKVTGMERSQVHSQKRGCRENKTCLSQRGAPWAQKAPPAREQRCRACRGCRGRAWSS